MGKVKTCLWIAAVALTAHSVGAASVRAGGNVTAAQGDEKNCDACCDTSEHTVRFVTVAPNVTLEVLDWGGSGETIVLLTGGGDNAHVYDSFAYHFLEKYRVIGITRRGFGRSSQPADGYDLDARAKDDIAVLDALNIRQAVFIGHSVAGTEMFKLAAVYPDRVRKLVFMDAVDLGSGGWANLPQPPLPPANTPWELESVQRLAAASALTDGYRPPVASLCNSVVRDAAGRILGPVSPPEIGGKVTAGIQPAQYDRIKAPALAIFNKISSEYRLPYYPNLSPAAQEEFRRSIKALSKWYEGAIQRFRSGMKNARIVVLHDTNHYVYIVDEPLVVREIRKFLREK